LDYGAGRFSLLDFRIATKRRLPAFMTFHGCDVRDFQEGKCPIPCGNPVCRLVDRSDCICTIISNADRCYVTTPDLLSALPDATYMPQSVYNLSDVHPTPPSVHDTLRVVHMPSSTSIKGSSFIINACSELACEGYDIELVLVKGIPHPEALAILDTADIVVDQLLVGWYGVQAIEAAARAKPVVVYLNEEYLRRVDNRPPFVNANPENIKETLRNLLAHKSGLVALGKECRDYVLFNHDAKRHAGRLVKDYEDVLGGR